MAHTQRDGRLADVHRDLRRPQRRDRARSRRSPVDRGRLPGARVPVGGRRHGVAHVRPRRSTAAVAERADPPARWAGEDRFRRARTLDRGPPRHAREDHRRGLRGARAPPPRIMSQACAVTSSTTSTTNRSQRWPRSSPPSNGGWRRDQPAHRLPQPRRQHRREGRHRRLRRDRSTGGRADRRGVHQEPVRRAERHAEPGQRRRRDGPRRRGHLQERERRDRPAGPRRRRRGGPLGGRTPRLRADRRRRDLHGRHRASLPDRTHPGGNRRTAREPHLGRRRRAGTRDDDHRHRRQARRGARSPDRRPGWSEWPRASG